ncbi:MAG: thiamine-phosphate kinase [Propionibacteriaceae bacterium]|nr:thiamine-phosphate kinase [Propionibacteriaceae bacterium]
MPETLADIGEFALIQRITAQVVTGPQVVLGPGDDAGVLNVDGLVVVSTDVMNEQVHFRRDWSSANNIGHRCVAGGLADIEAMGAVPTGVLLGLSAPGSTEVSWFDDFTAGVLEEIDHAHVSLMGGDLSQADSISIAVTALGETRGQPILTRRGAKVGDIVAYRGRLGYAAAGLAVLSRGFRSPRELVNAYRQPQVPYGAGGEAVRYGAHALMDISDGLVADLTHIAWGSQVVVGLDSSTIDLPEPLKAVAHATGRDPLDFVMAGGEDHALVGCFPPDSLPQSWKAIGEIEDPQDRDPGVVVDGEPWLGETGWSHF